MQLLRKKAGGAAWNHPGRMYQDYFSEKDGQIHHFDLCEECYDELVSGFKIPVDREEQIEFL